MLVIFILSMLVFGVIFIIFSVMGLFALLFSAAIPLDFMTVLKVFGSGFILLIIGFGVMFANISKEFFDSKKVKK